MMKTWGKRIASAVCAAAMCVALLPTTAFAEVTTENVDDENKIISVSTEDGATAIQDAINYIDTNAVDKIGWTITVGAGNYNRFTVLNGMDNLTIQAAEDATVTIETLNGSEAPAPTSGGLPDTGGISIREADGVTLKGLTINADNQSTPWYSSAVSDYMETGTVVDNFTIANCNFVGNNSAHGVFVNAHTTGFTVTGCTFNGFSECISMYGDGTVLNSASVTNNTFNNSSFALHGYYYTSEADSDAGVLTFSGNTINGTDALRCKVVIQNGSGADDGTQKNSAIKVNVQGNTLSNALVGLVNLTGSDWNADWNQSDVLTSNTFDLNSFYVEAIEPGTIDYYTTYQAPSGAVGYWTTSLVANGDITQDQVDYVKQLIAQANAEGSTTLSITNIPEGDLIKTFTYFKDGIYWVGGEPKTSYPGLEKKIINDEGKEVDADTSADNEDVDFILKSNVPNDLWNYIQLDAAEDPETLPPVMPLADGEEAGRGSYKLTFHDQMDEEFVNPRDFVVKIGNKELSTEQYQIAYNITHTNKDGTSSVCDFEITIDLVQLYEINVINGDDIENATPITVTFKATLAEGTTAGTYHNNAWVTYPNGESDKDTVEVETYDIKIYKYDQATVSKDEDGNWIAEALPGAEFTLYANAGCTEEIATAVSGNDGYAIFSGLDAGTYYLKETKAPYGYICSDQVVTVTVPEDASADNNTVFVNFANSLIPHTGGTGTMMYTIGGAAIVVIAGILLVVSRKSRKKQDR